MRPLESLGALLDDLLSAAALLLLVAPVVGIGVIVMFLYDKAKEVLR